MSPPIDPLDLGSQEGVVAATPQGIPQTSRTHEGEPAAADGVTNGTTPVTILAAATQNYIRVIPIGALVVFNRDSSGVTITLKNGTRASTAIVIAAAPALFTNDFEIHLDTVALTIELGGSVAATEPNFWVGYHDRLKA